MTTIPLRSTRRAGPVSTLPLTALDLLPWGKANVRDVASAPLAPGERAILRFAAVALVILTLGQKIAFPTDIEIGFYSTMALVGFLVIRGYGVIDPLRAIGYLVVMATCVLVTLLSPLRPPFSVGAVLFLVAIHVPFIVVVDVRRTLYLKFLLVFQWIALIVATLVYFQWAQQLVGMRMISLEDYVPSQFLYPNYNYIQKVGYFSKYYKPNAFLMLETSHTSQLLAIATLIEVCLFRRMFLLGYLFVAQIVTFGGTGMLMVIVTIPFIFRYVRPRLVLAGIIVLPLALAVAAQTGALDNAIGRSTEFDKPGTSGNGRFVSHFVVAAKSASVDADHALFGIGAGQVSPFVNDKTTVFVPSSKLVIEYGIPAAVMFLIWITYCGFSARVPSIVTWPVLILFNFIGGTLLIPINTYYYLLLTALFVPNRVYGAAWAVARRRRFPRSELGRNVEQASA